MYIGRFVILGKTAAGQWYLGYRVSSRSFPNRQIVSRSDRAVVLPTADAPPSDNPYIAYNCMRTDDHHVVVANGSHVDPIIDKLGLGYGLRDAMVVSLIAMDYEHDDYNTPRITAGLDLAQDEGYLGIVAEDKLAVQALDVLPGRAWLVATYERTDPTSIKLAGETADELVEALMDCEYEKPVAGMIVMLTEKGLVSAARTVGAGVTLPTDDCLTPTAIGDDYEMPYVWRQYWSVPSLTCRSRSSGRRLSFSKGVARVAVQQLPGIPH